jgi:hypothetical protein
MADSMEITMYLFILFFMKSVSLQGPGRPRRLVFAPSVVARCQVVASHGTWVKVR